MRRIARAPLRISLGGGGTDLPHYRSQYGGFVVSQAISRYVYVSVCPRYDGRIRVATTQDQTVSKAAHISHPIVREFFRLYKPEGGWDIHSSADIDGSSGLGSSGAFTVALMTAFLGYPFNRANRAEEAYMLEAGVSHCGPQDHYAAMFGYCHAFTFPAEDETSPAHPERLETAGLLANLFMYDTGVRRDADSSLKEVAESPVKHLHAIKRLGEDASIAIAEGRFDAIGLYMREHWTTKMKTQSIPAKAREMWDQGLHSGAAAGKLIGAGGGGFMLFYVDPDYHASFKEGMSGYREIPLSAGKPASLLEWPE